MLTPAPPQPSPLTLQSVSALPPVASLLIYLLTFGIINDNYYYTPVIKSFADDQTERIWRTGNTRGSSPASVTKRKFAMLDAAARLEDLKVPPGNRLEKLRGDREGQYSIRINDQYRICFNWQDGNAHDVELVDYH